MKTHRHRHTYVNGNQSQYNFLVNNKTKGNDSVSHLTLISN